VVWPVSAGQSKSDQIRKQLKIPEEPPENLRMEQYRAIEAIRKILDETEITAIDTPPEDLDTCKREMINNEDGTFTFIIKTEKEMQHWMLPVNSNEFYQGMTWYAAVRKVKEYGFNGVQGWSLPPSAVLHGIHRVNNDCPSKFAKVTGNPIIRGQVYHFAYWTSNEYSFVDSPEKLHADTVSLYTGNVIHERKENIGILWPAKLIHTERLSGNTNKYLKK
jgi:hypothetical protein